MSVTERELIKTAHNGDENAFRHLVEIHRTALLAHCYRMLGSPDDAEDALQDTLLHAWRGLPAFDGRGAFRRWLYRIATNTCLDAIARRQKRALPVDRGRRDGAPLPTDSLSIELPPDQLGLEDGYAAPEASYEQRETVELALVMALQHLPPRQLAVLVLREVLGFSAKEVSQFLGMTVISVNSALQRARRAVDERVPEKSDQSTMLGDASVHESVERFVHAFERGDVEVIVGLLAESAGFAPSHNLRRTGVKPMIRATGSLPHFRQPSKLAA
jgi:RNA polymerase sigma-70 factor (ECF subfamily)